MTYFLWVLCSLRFCFYRRLPFYPDSAYFFHYALFSPHSISKEHDIFYLSGSRVPILTYYRLLAGLSRIFRLSLKGIEHCSHFLLITLQGVLIYAILESIGVSENLGLFALLYFGYFLPPRTFSYFGNNEIFNSLLEVIFLFAFLQLDTSQATSLVIFGGSIFITWSLLSLKFLHFVKFPIYAYFFFHSAPMSALFGLLIGSFLAAIPHLQIKSEVLWRTLRSYVKSNKDHRSSVFTPLHRDFIFNHFPGIVCILVSFFYFPDSWKWFFTFLVMAEIAVIFAQHNGYPYHGIPMLKFYPIFGVFLPPWISITLLIIYLIIGLRKPLRLFPHEFKRLDQMVQVQNEIGDYLDGQLAEKSDSGLLTWGHFTTVHVLSRVPEYHGCIYAFQFIQNLEELELTYPGWKDSLRKKLKAAPPEYVLIYLDGYQILDIRNISRITGCNYELEKIFYQGRILLFRKNGECIATDEEFKLFSKSGLLLENVHQLSSYLRLKAERMVVFGENLRLQAEELFPDSKFIQEEEFLQLRALDSRVQYVLFTDSYQNDLLDRLEGMNDQILITKLR